MKHASPNLRGEHELDKLAGFSRRGGDKPFLVESALKIVAAKFQNSAFCGTSGTRQIDLRSVLITGRVRHVVARIDDKLAVSHKQGHKHSKESSPDLYE